ncbi:gluconokinase [Amaricoccus solimangrovi]|uniref:Gluconokinase n=1 Tax=Amaricoccus solimangrovi TaxID=2589815 RepID=A0A501WMG2_9RHOB|nr:gluconokinase [Amaricoccus solimangrovi]TPE49530.1 gluconokinase [Amaricoccus solimangrovi]
MAEPLTEPVSERRAIVVMGVCGCGKTSVGEGIAARLGAGFVEGDALHPAANVAKMAAGTPLTDEDRWPWLRAIAARIAEEPGAEIVVSCSALRRAYRDLIRQGAGRDVRFVFLSGSEALLARRMGAREGHFMPPELLASQLATLEDPRGEPGVVSIDIEAALPEIIDAALAALAERVAP